MNCEAAQLVLSTRMDGERVSVRHAEAAVEHAETCARCRAFAERSARIRSGVRIRAAEPVPDLVDPIMAAVARERTRPVPLPRVDRRTDAVSDRARHRRPWTLAPAVAAAIAGMVLGSVLVGGPWQSPANRPIAAATVVRNVRTVAPTLDAFEGRYVIHEFGLDPAVPERVLDMLVAFRSPQRFRLEVQDRTIYPSPSWTPTDLRYIQDVTTTFTSGPSGCPGDLPADVCPRTRAAVTHLSEFSAAAPLPADLVLPISTFGSATGFQVLGEDRIGGRDAIRVRLSFERAAPMFPFLRIGGTWRPFFDRDPVLLWLDARSWLPLRIVVHPVAEPRTPRVGAAVRPGGRVARSRRSWTCGSSSVSEEPPDASTSSGSRDLPAAASRTGWRTSRTRIGYLPGDIRRIRATSSWSRSSCRRPSAPATPSSVLVYAEGLDYLKVGERRDWAGPGPFGPLDPVAQRVPLRDDGVAYYEPAGEGFGRRLAIHTPTADLFLETNLPRERLLEIAASLPVVGRPAPRGVARPRVARRRRGADRRGRPGSPRRVCPRRCSIDSRAATSSRAPSARRWDPRSKASRSVPPPGRHRRGGRTVDACTSSAIPRFRPRPPPSRAGSRSPVSRRDGRRAARSSNGSTTARTTRSKES